jgi:hypothetical protein
MNIVPAVASYDSYLQSDMDFKLAEKKNVFKCENNMPD